MYYGLKFDKTAEVRIKQFTRKFRSVIQGLRVKNLTTTFERDFIEQII